MEAKGRIKQIGNILFYITLIIEIGVVLVDKSTFTNPIEGQIFRLTFLLCVLKIMITKYSLKEFGVMIIFFIVGAISYFITGRNEIIRVVFFIIASKDIDLKKALKLTFYMTLVGVLILVALSLTGTLGSMFLEVDYRGNGVEKRYCLGLGHPNALHCMAWALLTLGIYLYFARLKWYHYLIMMLGNLGLYVLTVSRTGGIVAFMTILAAFILYLFPKLQNQKWIYILGALIVLFGVFFSVIMAVFGCSLEPLAWFDKYLTGRITWGYQWGNISYWSLFSNPENTAYFDNGFMRLFYWYGIIPGILYTIVNCFQVYWSYKKKDAAALLLIVMFSIYTVFEAHTISVYIARNYLLLLLIGVWTQVFCIEGGKDMYFWQLKRKKM